MRAAELWTRDGLAALLSSICLVHCMALPLAAAALPSLALAPGAHSLWLHVLLLAVALPVSAAALLSGWRAHGRAVPAALAALGFAVMAAAVALHGAGEAALTVAGGLVVAAAHLRNRRLAH